MKRRKPLRRRVRTQRKSRPQIRELDELARAIVMTRDRECCVRCGSRPVQWAHVYTRALHSLRWMPENSMALCARHHLQWHREPAESAGWWLETYPKRAAKLATMRAFPQKIDRAAIKLWLTAELTRLQPTRAKQ